MSAFKTKIKSNYKILRSTTVLACAIAGFGCAQVSTEVDTSKVSVNTSGLVQQTNLLPTLVYIRPNAPTLAEYTKFVIEPVSIDSANANIRALDQQDVADMQAYLTEVMTTALTDGGYKLVSRNESDALIIKFTIKDMKLPNAGTNVSMLVVPGLSTSVGEVTLEATFTDSNSQKLNAVVVESSRGSYMFNNNPLTTTSDVKDAFKSWAEGFRKSLDAAHSKSGS
jgi:hypothetical protein